MYTGFAVLIITPIALQAKNMIAYSGQLLLNIKIVSPFLNPNFTKALATLMEYCFNCLAVKLLPEGLSTCNVNQEHFINSVERLYIAYITCIYIYCPILFELSVI